MAIIRPLLRMGHIRYEWSKIKCFLLLQIQKNITIKYQLTISCKSNLAKMLSINSSSLSCSVYLQGNVLEVGHDVLPESVARRVHEEGEDVSGSKLREWTGGIGSESGFQNKIFEKNRTLSNPAKKFEGVRLGENRF